MTSVYCDVIANKDCKLHMKNTKIEVTHWNNKEKPHYTCEYDTKNFTVMKTKPICADVPKYICTSNWKVHPIKGKVSMQSNTYLSKGGFPSLIKSI